MLFLKKSSVALDCKTFVSQSYRGKKKKFTSKKITVVVSIFSLLSNCQLTAQ